jgi:acyl carrier protein
LSTEQGLELFDQAQRSGEALLVPVHLDLAVLRGQVRAGMLPPLLRGLVRVSGQRGVAAGGSLAQRLAGVPEADRESVVLELVRAQVAAVLGHASADAIEAQRAFKELGFDSLAAVELRNRLTQASGVRLPSTLVFDHPTPVAVAKFIVTEVGGPDREAGASPLAEELQRFEALLTTVAGDERQLAEYESRLRSLSNRLRSVLGGAAGRHDEVDELIEDDLDEVSDEEMFELIDKELGSA